MIFFSCKFIRVSHPRVLKTLTLKTLTLNPNRRTPPSMKVIRHFFRFSDRDLLDDVFFFQLNQTHVWLGLKPCQSLCKSVNDHTRFYSRLEPRFRLIFTSVDLLNLKRSSGITRSVDGKNVRYDLHIWRGSSVRV